MLGLDPKNTTVKAMFATWERRSEERRTYIGASVIGKECDRALWLSFRWAFKPEQFEGRMLRLFNRGHREEPVFEKELADIGCEVEGTQHEEIGCNGHFKMHCDGVVLGLIEAPKTWHVVDFKTMSEKNFKRFVKCGADEDKLLEEFPEYYAQLHVEMEMMGLKRAALFAVNKNTDDLHMIRLRASEAGAYYVQRAQSTIDAKEPQACERTAADFRCRFCDAHGLCFGTQAPQINCRTCCYSTPVEDGKWTCSKHIEDGEVISKDTMCNGCEWHIWIPGLLTWGMYDYGDGWVLYENGVLNAGAKQEVSEDVEFGIRATSQEIARNHSTLSDGEYKELEAERQSFPEETVFTDVEAEGDPRKQQLLDLIEGGDENAKADYFKEYGPTKGE